MKNIQPYILEKLILNKSIVQKKIDISKVEVDWRTKSIFNASQQREKKAQLKKMVAYCEKNTNPKSLYRSSMEIWTLAARWMCAILLEWDEAIEILQNELVKSKFAHKPENIEEQLFAYIYGRLKKTIGLPNLADEYGFWEETDDHLKYYLDKYNVQY